MLKDKISKRISLSLTAEDWDLFDMPNNDIAANALNVWLEMEVNAGKSRAEVTSAMSKMMMGSIREYGTADTEPMRVLERLLDIIYGER